MYAQYVTSYEYDAANRLERTLLPMATGETQHYVYQELDKVASG